jgi:murein DD-endopeptidase MepM/ murein hydrolase activator NlpD
MPAYETYTVRRGDTLSRIARNHGVTVDALKALNDIDDANKVQAGAALRIRALTEAFPETPLAPPPAAGAATRGRPIGGLSSKYEVAKGGCGTCSTGKGDRGGVSYGSYQLASNLNRPAEFLAQEGRRWRDRFGSLPQGTPGFSAIWKQIAVEEPVAFHAAQHDYIQRTHYAVQVAHVKAKTGVDLSAGGPALQDVVWSTAVQHGPNGDIIVNALKAVALKPGDPSFERELIKAIYAERGRYNDRGELVYFSKNSKAVQAGVADRFRRELKDALELLKSDEVKQAVTTAAQSEGDAGDDLLARAAERLTDEDVNVLLERYGDHEAVNDFLAGKKVLVALRKSTNTRTYRNGVYDDAMLLIGRAPSGRIQIQRFPGNTEPCGRYAYDGVRASHGSSTDLNRDGKMDLGRLVPGTYHYRRMPGQFLGAPYFQARDVQVCVRDTNQDGWFDPADGARIDPKNAVRSMYIHRGGEEETWSAGCQTIPTSRYSAFLAALGEQTALSYILIDAD